MAVKKKVARKTTGPVARATPRGVTREWGLPTEKSVPKANMGEYSILIYGEKKIGKTTIAAEFPDALFLMCEPGAKDLSVYKVDVKNWGDLVHTIDLLEKTGAKFKTVIMDTVDAAYDMCFDYMCIKLVIDHPHDANDYGKSWKKIKQEFARQINRLMRLGGFIALSHATLKEVDTLEGKIARMMPTLSGQAEEVLVGLIDIWAYYGYSGGTRLLTIRGNEFVGGGTRLQNHFNTPDGKQILEIPMGRSAKEAYTNLLAAYNNEQQSVKGGTEERAEKTGSGVQKKPIKRR